MKTKKTTTATKKQASRTELVKRVEVLEARLALASATARAATRGNPAGDVHKDEDEGALARRLPLIAIGQWGREPATAVRHAVSSLYLLSAALEHDDCDGNFGTHNARLIEIVDVLDAVVERLEECELASKAAAS